MCHPAAGTKCISIVRVQKAGGNMQFKKKNSCRKDLRVVWSHLVVRFVFKYHCSSSMENGIQEELPMDISIALFGCEKYPWEAVLVLWVWTTVVLEQGWRICSMCATAGTLREPSRSAEAKLLQPRSDKLSVHTIAKITLIVQQNMPNTDF